MDFEELSPIICLSYVWLSYVRRETYCGNVRGELVSEEILIEAWVPQHQLGDCMSFNLSNLTMHSLACKGGGDAYSPRLKIEQVHEF